MRSLTALSLFIVFATAQTCYFPDGKTVSDDVPCSTGGVSACCPSDSFCTDNGLCFGGGILARSSCTDASWSSGACASHCRNESTSSSIAITPLTQNTFACGLNSTTEPFTLSGGSGIVLRASQAAQLVNAALSSSSQGNQTNATACSSQPAAANSTGMYTSAQMAGLGCGIGLPLAFALCVALILLRREQQKHAPPKLMYKLPDDVAQQEFTFRPPPPLGKHPALATRSVPTSGSNTASPSRRESLKTSINSRPPHLQSFVERYAKPRHELDSSSPHSSVQRHELEDSRRE